jgi:hypothetical protein
VRPLDPDLEVGIVDRSVPFVADVEERLASFERTTFGNSNALLGVRCTLI